MGVLQYYSIIHNYNVKIKQPKPYTPGVVIPTIIVEDAVPVTLSEFAAESKNAITAHRIKDYRRVSTSLVLLPEVETLYDKLLEGSVYVQLLSGKE